jgi:hypothetical protein
MLVNNITPQINKDIYDVQTDPLLQLIASKTAEEIEEYFEAQVSAIATSTDGEIDTYIDGLNSVNDVKEALRFIAKDSSFNSNMLKKLAKIISILAEKGL